MRPPRRQFLNYASWAAACAAIGPAALPLGAAGGDYKALLVLYLNGGNDGNNVLVPTDGAYSDYESSRGVLALPRSSLLSLPAPAAGHTFGLHPSLAPLMPLYNSGRLGLLSNVGPLIEPSTAEQVINRSVKVPSFLGSHSDQTAIVQGWMPEVDNSGWAGRALERLDTSLRNPLSAVTTDSHRTLVLGRSSPVTFMPTNGMRWWGQADLLSPERQSTQYLLNMAKWQFSNDYEAEYRRTLGASLDDSTRLTRALVSARAPTADFGGDHLGAMTRSLASVLPVFREQGLRRQVFLMSWGGFDTHAGQRGTGPNTQDTQLRRLAEVLAAFDRTNVENGLDQQVVTLVMSEFGRTLRTGSGSGSEHAWGNHWMLMGGPVVGRTVHGVFPRLILGGPDDMDTGKNGRLVPTMSSDQVGATLMRWMGLSPNDFPDVFPYLKNFRSPTLPLLYA